MLTRVTHPYALAKAALLSSFVYRKVESKYQLEVM